MSNSGYIQAAPRVPKNQTIFYSNYYFSFISPFHSFEQEHYKWAQAGSKLGPKLCHGNEAPNKCCIVISSVLTLNADNWNSIYYCIIMRSFSWNCKILISILRYRSHNYNKVTMKKIFWGISTSISISLFYLFIVFIYCWVQCASIISIQV